MCTYVFGCPIFEGKGVTRELGFGGWNLVGPVRYEVEVLPTSKRHERWMFGSFRSSPIPGTEFRVGRRGGSLYVVGHWST